MMEQRETILDNDYITAWCYPRAGIIYHQFHKYIFGEPFKEALMTELEAFEKKGCTKWLSDDRLFGALLPEDKKWSDEVWRPRIIKAGWAFWAMVLPDKMTGKLNIQRMVDEYEKLGINTQIFSEPDDALKWLLNQ